MVRDTSTSKGNQEAEEAGPPIQISKSDWEHERIARRAYELYDERGRQESQDVQDWLEAQQQLLRATGT
ncbi:MAG TPA: DUF2934 domain-containing protein [Nitrospira sp.]|nr:DUF2934 domain-containing protein [Nitrospira sp.]